MSEVIYRYGVQVKGIKKRCRKPDFHSAELARRKEIDPELAKQLAKKWVVLNMKSVSKACATVRHIEIEGNIERWAPFNEDHNHEFHIKVEQ